MKKNYIDKIRQRDAESGLFILGILLFLIAVLIYLVFQLVHIDPFTFLGTTFGACPFYRLTGHFCPGCGGTRAFQAFITGHFIKSFLDNAFVWYVMTCYVCFMMSQSARVITKGRCKGFSFKMRYIYLGVVVLLLQWIIKNVVLLMS